MRKTYMAAEDSDTGIKIYLREIGQIPLLTPQQEIELAAKIKKGDREARALMIRSNLRLVVKIAHDYANLGLPLLDLISEGNIGLRKAVERFDPAKGGKLSTYAAWWIRTRRRRSNFCATTTCATKSAVCSTCSTIAKRKLFSSALDSMVESQRLSKRLARNSALPASAFGSCKTLRCRNCVAR